MPPKFSQNIYKGAVVEDHPSEFTKNIPRPLRLSPPIKAFDQDRSINADVVYSITSGNDMQYFRIDPETADIFVIKPIDLEELDVEKFTLEITARQKSNELKFAIADIEIEVIDINDNKPEFEVEQYNMTVIENLPVGFRILQFTAKDQDKGENGEFYYELEDNSGAFILEDDGSLVLNKPSLFDREQMENVVLKVLAIEKSDTVLENKVIECNICFSAINN